jgi:hypothetical protein
MALQSAWDPQAFSPMINPNGPMMPANQFDMGYMMGGAMGMMPPPLPQMSNLFDLPVRFVFP